MIFQNLVNTSNDPVNCTPLLPQYIPASSKDEGFTLKKPGACHHARFMAKAIYYLKMSLLFSQLCKIFHPRELVEIEVKRHPWYLNKELVILCLADKELSCPIKKAMALALFKCERPASLAPGKPKFPQEVFSEEVQEKHKDNILSGLVDLIGPESWTIPILLGLSEDDMVWLQLEVHQ